MFKFLLVLVFLINSLAVLDEHHHLFFKSIFDTLESRHVSSYQADENNNLIDCLEFKENVTLIRKISEGVVKEVWLGKWSSKGYIAVSFLKNSIYSDDFLHNIYMLRNFTMFGSKFTAKYLGNCDQTILFTKFYKLGSFNNFYHLLPHLIDENSKQNHKLASKFCFQFCINYAKVIDHLHNSPIGRRVMCDSNDLAKLTSQFLIDDDLSLIANDLDALPDATQQIRCGNRSVLIGDLIAPEQKLKNSNYDEKIDIFKLPFVCNYVLSLCPENELLNLLVNQLHKRCLNQMPTNRPNSTEIVNEYLKINYTLFS